VFNKLEFIGILCIFAAFVPLIRNLPHVLMTGLSASGILSGVMKKKFLEVRSEEDAQCTYKSFSIVIKINEIDSFMVIIASYCPTFSYMNFKNCFSIDGQECYLFIYSKLLYYFRV